MGTSYRGVGGIGIEFTEELIQKFIVSGHFTQEEWDYNYNDCFDKIDLDYENAGNLYIDSGTQYVFVPGNNLKEINENVNNFIEKFKNLGVEISIEDLKVVSEIRVC